MVIRGHVNVIEGQKKLINYEFIQERETLLKKIARIISLAKKQTRSRNTAEKLYTRHVR